ncbi:60S ribosomal protein L7 [Entamoeba marina]
MSSSVAHKPKQETKVVIRKSTITQIMAERKKRKHIKDRIKRIQKKDRKINIRSSLEQILALKRKSNSEKIRTRFMLKRMKKYGLPQPIQNKPIAVCLVRSAHTATAELKQILKGFGLRRQMSVVVIASNEENLKNLSLVSLYVTFGYVNESTIRELIIRRGFLLGKDGLPQQITSNAIVKEAFEGVIDNVECIEDLVYEFANGEHLKEICGVIKSFQFTPMKFFNFRHNKIGGVTGQRENMNEWLLKRL